MRAPHYSNELKLAGATGDDPRSERVNLLMHLLESAGAKINHFDTLRQRNLLAALAIFAGLAGLNLRIPSLLAAGFGSAALAGVMIVFTIYERRLHRYSEGWQGTRATLAERIQDLINDPEKELTFSRYYPEFEASADRWSIYSRFYLFLAVAGPTFFTVFAILGESSA